MVSQIDGQPTPGQVPATGSAEDTAAAPLVSGSMPATGWLSVQSYGATGDGTTDDTAAIQAAIDAVGSGGGVVFFPLGVYVTSAPIVVQQTGVVLMGVGQLATQGGGGSGTGTFTPGTAGTIKGPLLAGSVIAPSSGWAQGTAKAPAAILVDASGAEIDKAAIERMWVYGGNAGLTTVHGIAVYGKANATLIRGCGVLVLYSAESNGIVLLESHTGDAVGAGQDPDGTMVDQCLCQFVGANGIQGDFGDGTITRCHTQNVGGTGFFISNNGLTGGSGGNVRISDCRGDLSGHDGFYLDITCGEYLGMVQLVNCSTQRNNGNGFHVSSTAAAKNCPVYLSNCVAQGDAAGTGVSAGYCFSGPCASVLTNCSCHVDTVQAPGSPAYAVLSTAAGVSAPVLVQIIGGLMNARTSWLNAVNAPLAFDYRVFVFTGGQWTYQDTPTLQT